MSNTIASRSAYLFAPRETWRLRYNSDFGGEEQSRSSSGDPQYPQAGAMIDYWVSPNSGQVTLEIIAADGSIIRRLSSEAAAPNPSGERRLARRHWCSENLTRRGPQQGDLGHAIPGAVGCDRAAKRTRRTDGAAGNLHCASDGKWNHADATPRHSRRPARCKGRRHCDGHARAACAQPPRARSRHRGKSCCRRSLRGEEEGRFNAGWQRFQAPRRIARATAAHASGALQQTRPSVADTVSLRSCGQRRSAGGA